MSIHHDNISPSEEGSENETAKPPSAAKVRRSIAKQVTAQLPTVPETSLAVPTAPETTMPDTTAPKMKAKKPTAQKAEPPRTQADPFLPASNELRSPSKVERPDLFNLLSEERPNPSRFPFGGETYNHKVTEILRSHPLRSLFNRMLDGYGLNPPVLSLALLAPVDSTGSISMFKSFLWKLRNDLGVRYPDATECEAALWGVAQPSDWQIAGYRSEVERMLGASIPTPRESMALALIKIEGVKRVHAFLYAVEEKMFAWNPLTVWEQGTPFPRSCTQAADSYLHSFGYLIPTPRHEATRNLAMVVWNRRKLVDQASMLKGSGIKGLEVAKSALLAAVANRAPSSGKQSVSHADLLAVLNPINKRALQELEKVLDKLPLQNDDPHRTFLRTLVLSARAENNIDAVLQRSLASIGQQYSSEDVRKLLHLEYSLLPPVKPTPIPVPDKVEYCLEKFLVSTLREYVEASQRNFLVRVLQLQDKTLRDGRTSLVESDFAKLAELSVILAGIPGVHLESALKEHSASR